MSPILTLDLGGIKPLSRGGSRIYEMGINIRREARCRIGEHV